MAETTVIKFGGACFAGPSDYTGVAQVVADRTRDGGRVVVVVSAMHRHTAELQAALDAIDPNPPPEAAAQVLTTGDLQSAALLAAAVGATGVRAELLPSHNVGLRASGSPLRAQLAGVNGAYLREMVRDHQVVVLPGGQATDSGTTDHHATVVMLGRNSSDLTAVCIAAALRIRTCHIVSGVLGVFTADPVLVPNARLIDSVDYRTVLEAGRSGARVLHPQAVRMARTNRIEIRCAGRPPEMPPGTRVGPFRSNSEPIVVAAADSGVWRLDGVDEMQEVQTELQAESIESLPVHHEGAWHVVVTDDFSEALARTVCGRRGTQTGLRLLSVIQPGIAPERHLVPADALVEAARRAHDDLVRVP
jgi:aspartate kinase